MKTRHRVVIAALGLGLLIILVDAWLDSIFFYEGSFLELLVTDVPAHEFYVRALMLLCFLGFGFAISWMIERHERIETRYRAIFERAPLGIFQTTVDGRAVRVNAEMARMVGCETPEAAVAAFTDLRDQLYVDPERRAEFVEHLHRDGEVIDFAYRARRLDGEIRWFLMNARMIGGPDDPEALLEGFTRDITERRQAEADRERLLNRVQQQAQQLSQIMRAVPEGVLLVDAEGRVVTANPVGRAHLAVLADVGPGEILSRLGNRSLKEVLTSPPTRGLWHQIQADARHFEVIARPIADRDRPEAWVLVVRDVTQERVVQQQRHQQERLASVGQLAAGIAHDFNNIMAVILLYADLSIQMLDRAPDTVRERLEIIVNQAHQASELIQQILDFSRRSTLERQVMDLAPFLKEQCKLLERTLPEHIRVIFESPPGMCYVNGDPTRLQQVMVNLALNARDALPEGGELRVTLDRLTFSESRDAPMPELPAGAWVRWSVMDTGTGIEEEVRPHIFEPFFTTKAPGAGSGLGLPQVHGIITQHEGAIDVTTHVGKGTRFDLYLPALTSACELEPLLESETEPVRGGAERILIVEDNPSVRRALEGTLRALNYRVFTVANGREALDWMRHHVDEVDLVLSDVVMPEMGGRALLHALRAERLSLPVVLLTGHPMHDELDVLTEDRLTAWLSKPPHPVTLARALRDLLTS